jgi:hypothetical protein
MKHPLCLWEINFEEIHFYYQAVNYGSNAGTVDTQATKFYFLSSNFPGHITRKISWIVSYIIAH